MPVHKYDIDSRHERDDLVDLIRQDLMLSASTAVGSFPPAEEAPDIYIKKGAPPDYPTRVYVVWDKWKGVPESKRRGIIIDAMEKAGKPYEADRVVIAMGLMRDEADALGISE